MIPENPNESMSKAAGVQSQRDRFSLLSHDMRSALADILGGLQLINSSNLDDATRAHLDRIGVAGEVFVRLLDKAAEEGTNSKQSTVTRTGNVNLSEFLEDIRKRWHGHARERRIGFEVSLAASLPAVVTLDRVALERILANLIGNALKFCDAGQVRLTVEFTDEKSLVFKICDDGPGFSAAALEKLFQYAGRPDDAGKPGSGLGLFIAKELSDLIGANISVGNSKLGGAQARVEIPYDAWFDRSLRREVVQAIDRKEEKSDLKGLKILLAEDDMTNQLVATQMLDLLGAKYSVASDGLEAMEFLEREEFDLALLDIEMPRMSGLELIKAVRMMPAPLSEMPLIALTAYVMREHRERIYNAGADGIIAKPLMSVEEFGAGILGFMSGRERAREVDVNIFDANDPAVGEIVDRDIFDTLVQTIGPDSAAELLGKLQTDTDSVAEGLARGQKSLDLAEIRTQTHILISVAGAIGAKNLQHSAQELNNSANRDGGEAVDELCQKCLAGLQELQTFIREEQAKAESLAEVT